MLEAFFEIGCSGTLVAALFHLIPGVSQEQQDYLAGPLVVHRSAWADTLPEWLKKAALKGRLRRVADELNGAAEADGRCSDEEALCFMYPATMEAPLPHEWIEIYLYLGQRVMARHGRCSEEAFAEGIGAPKVSDYDLKYYLHRLQRDVRASCVRAAAEHRRAQKRQLKAEEQAAAAPPDVIPDNQLNLF